MGGMMGPGGNGMTQGAFRFRADNDGTETDEDESNGGATWLQAIETPISLPINYGTFRARIHVYYNDTSDATHTFQLYVAKNDFVFGLMQNDGAGLNCSLSKTRSGILVDGDDSTEYLNVANDLKEPSGFWADTTNGCVVVNNNFDRTGQVNFPGDGTPQGISIEWVIAMRQQDLATNDVLRFRVQLIGATPFTGTYGDHEAEVTVLAPVEDPSPYLTKQLRTPMMRQATR